MCRKVGDLHAAIAFIYPAFILLAGKATRSGGVAESNKGEGPLGFGEPTCWCFYCQLTKNQQIYKSSLDDLPRVQIDLKFDRLFLRSDMCYRNEAGRWLRSLRNFPRGIKSVQSCNSHPPTRIVYYPYLDSVVV